MANLKITNPNDLGVLVVGAGIAGLTLARNLVRHGMKVTVFDKSRGVGGRLASRRGGGLTWDHGIVALHPSDIPPEIYVDWKSLGILESRKDQASMSWICPEGMTQLPKALEQGVDVVRDAKIDLIRIGPGGKVWMIRDDSGTWHYGNKLVLAVPAPQAELLLEASFPQQMVSLKESLAQIKYRPTLTVLATVSRKKYPELSLKAVSPIEMIIENGEKGIKMGTGALTIHLNEAYSVKNFELSEQKVLREIKSLVASKMGIEISNLVLKKWRYSQVTHALEDPFLSAKLTSPLFVIGDGFCGGGLKGSLMSASSLADRLINPPATKEPWRPNGKKAIHLYCPK
ncbi:MAG: FAD-dependent oxidoreductase [Proteobacteria bacterium]|nr:FAD-dependent oxidoreductase [Pseudomonadota bacterium]NBY20656.1 FAD-dependent oxidoreductase [bacterium]